MRVELTYFKLSGKYYMRDEYDTSKEHLFEIWDEVAAMVKPGWIVLVLVPEHPHNHPKLIGLKE